ncbi:WD40 repeat domain-containing protein [Kutzneria kofuensis]|uniref:WD40 repeat protein/energy-coupling factor transporter ATP-binding protein EcfA2 n=1 Tax=Kutzneria kofuensis TaxID=103725 RepID=A0A7W9KNY9_9PSEU|nr:WD40 repeat domain-containing protein [Kutzneria kofuensis]MBB5896068.1 WD40 repeat protein/energy-coupling factor transporter ATP-binding protein EcfA2 [Kutzneria kofuensis]
MDAGDTPLLRFAADLRKLREAAGNPVYRELSRRSHYSAPALSEAAGGRKLPTLAVTLAYVAACDGDTELWERRWREVAAGKEAPAEPAADAEAPYLGLSPFRIEDADRFHGRDALLAELREQVASRRFVGVFGASGSGKSSLLHAGLAAVAQTEGVAGTGPQPTLLLSPGPHPLEECAVQLAKLTGESAVVLKTELETDPDHLHLRIRQALASQPDDADLLLVVDQFEEIFTLCEDHGELAAFIRALVGAATAEPSRVRVVLGVRADFLGHCGDHPDLREALRGGQVLVGPMTADELREAIMKPAAAAGCSVETALVVRLVADASNQPGALPLVSHALRETWRRRRGIAVTLAAYNSTGGIHHAIAHTAESVYDRFDQQQRDVVKQILLRLTALGEATEDTKRRITIDELDDDPTVRSVLDELVRARLVTMDQDTIEITHEALIKHWPRLRSWLAADRDALRLHRQVADDAAVWESLLRDPDALYRGVRLAQARELDDAALTARERAFLAASLAAESAQQAAARRRSLLLRMLVVVLAGLLVIATIATAEAMSANRTIAAQRDVVLAQQVADAAVALRTDRPELAAQLALAAYRMSPTRHNRDDLLSAVAIPLKGHEQNVASVAFSPDGKLLATASFDHTARLWDLSNPAHPRSLPEIAGHTDSVDAVAFSPNGKLLATGGRDRTIRLWSLDDPVHPAQLAVLTGHRDNVFSLMFSPDSRVLASGSYDHTARLWDVATRSELRTLDAHTNNVKPVAFSPDGHTLATASDDRTIRLWDVSNPADPGAPSVLGSHRDLVDTVAFSPDGQLLASGSDDKTVRLWDIGHPGRSTDLHGHTDVVSAVAFSRDGRTLASASYDHTVRLWDYSDPAKPTESAVLTGHTSSIESAAFSPDGHTLATASDDHTAQLWETDPARAEVRACQIAHPVISQEDWNTYLPGVDYQPPC